MLITSSPIGARARGASCRRADFFAAGVRDGGVKDGAAAASAMGSLPCNTPDQTNRMTSLVDSRFVDHFVTYRCAREGRELPARRFFCRWGEGWWGERWCGRRFSYGVVALQHPRSNQPHDELGDSRFVDHFVTYRCAREGRELPARRFFCRWGEGWWGERWCGRRFSYGVVALQHPRSNQPHDELGGFALC